MRSNRRRITEKLDVKVKNLIDQQGDEEDITVDLKVFPATINTNIILKHIELDNK